MGVDGLLWAGLCFSCAWLMAWLGTPVAIWFGRRVAILDRPGELAIHTQAVPRTGGLAMLLAFVTAVALGLFLSRRYLHVTLFQAGDVSAAQLAGLLAGLVLIALTGLLDDIRRITPLQKFVAQLFAVAVAVGAGVQLGLIPVAGVAFSVTMLYLVGGANALNLLDGMNGLAAGVAAIAALALAGLAAWQGSPALILAGLALAGAALGYLPYNFPRAQLFMGDAGSLSLGFVLAAVAVLLARDEGDARAFVAGLVVLGLPVVDTGLAIGRRLARMADVFSGDRDHVYDLLARQGLGPTRTVWVMYAIALALGVVAWIAYRAPIGMAIALAAACYAALAAWAISLGALGPAGLASLAQLRQPLAVAARRYTHLLVFDVLVVLLAFYSALFLRFVDELIVAPAEYWHYLYSSSAVMPFVVVAFLFANAAVGLYNRWWPAAGLRDAVAIVAAGLWGGAVVLVADILWGVNRPIPMGVVLIGSVFSIAGFGLCRYRRRLLGEMQNSRRTSGVDAEKHRSSERVLIVGAGEAGQSLAWRMQRDPQQRYAPVAFVDDDVRKHGWYIHGVPVGPGIGELAKAVAVYEPDVIVLVKDGVAEDDWQVWVGQARDTGKRVHILQNVLDELQAGNGSIRM